MTQRWVVRLAAQDGATAAALRAFAGVEVHAGADALWLRGPCDDGPVERAMWLLSGDRYRLAADGKLIPWDHLLPIGACPDGPWAPLSSFIRPAAAAPALPGAMATPHALRLVRSAGEQAAAMLQLDLPTWAAYIDTAPTLRLSRLQFALCDPPSVLVRGEPLPALPGMPLTLDHGIAVPCGMRWLPAVAPKVIAESLALAADDIALFSADATHTLVPASAWTSVTRSAVRVSLGGVHA